MWIFATCVLSLSFKPQLYSLQAVWSQESCLSFLCSSVFIYKMGIIVVPTSESICEELNELVHVKYWEQCLVHPQLLIHVAITTSATLISVTQLLLIRSLWRMLEGECGERFWWTDFHPAAPSPPLIVACRAEAVGMLVVGGGGGAGRKVATLLGSRLLKQQRNIQSPLTTMNNFVHVPW